MYDFNDLALYVLCGELDKPRLHGIVSNVLGKVSKHLNARPPLPSLDAEWVLEGRIEHVFLIVTHLVLVLLAFLQMRFTMNVIAYIADFLDVVLKVVEPVDGVGQEGEVEELLPTRLLLYLLRAIHYLAS